MPPRITVSPPRPAFDDALRIVVDGLPAGAAVTLRASQTDPTGTPWGAVETFTAGADGTVVPERPMRLITSMTPDAAAPIATPDVLTLVAEVDAAPVAVVHVERLRVPEGLLRSDLTDGVGVRYEPADGRTGLPGVLLLGGSEGGLHDTDAALLARHGFVVVALAYFGAPGLPAALVDVPLEYLARAVDGLAAHPRVDPSRVVVAGGSKGGEAALLVGAHFPAVRGVVSVVGSGVVTQGADFTLGSFLDIVATPVAGWTLGGEPVPYLPHVVADEVRDAVAEGAPTTLRSVFRPALDLPVREAATIPVERVNGPVLLLSAQDDQGYGPEFHEIAAARLAAHGRPHEHVVYPGAGHLIAAPPYSPTTVSVLPGPGVLFAHGGTPEATAFAREDAWRRLREFVAGL